MNPFGKFDIWTLVGQMMNRNLGPEMGAQTLARTRQAMGMAPPQGGAGYGPPLRSRDQFLADYQNALMQQAPATQWTPATFPGQGPGEPLPPQEGGTGYGPPLRSREQFLANYQNALGFQSPRTLRGLTRLR